MATAVQAPVEVPKPTPEAEAIFNRWLTHLNDEFTRHTSCDRRSEIVRDELHMLVLGRPHGGRRPAMLDTDLPLDVLTESFDPRNISLPAEMPSRCCNTLDKEKWCSVKPLLWFWTQFDRLPLGQNLWLAFRFHNVLGQHIFEKMGKDVYIYPGVTFLRGYNITMLDGTRIEPGVFIDDKEPIHVSGRVSK